MNAARQLDRNQPLTYSQLIKLFIPLSLSDMILIASAPLVGATLARLPDTNTHLAAYGAAQSMALLVESPVIMLIQAGAAAAGDAVAYRTLHRLMVWLCVLTTALMALLAWTPLFGLVFESLLGLPPDIAAAARPAVIVLLLWPAAIGWRRYYQGWLIHKQRPHQIMIAGFIRLATMSATLVGGWWLQWPGALVGGLGLTIGVIAEGAAVRFFARDVKDRDAADSEASNRVPREMGALIRWYLPLAGTQFLVFAVRPLMTAGIARGVLPILSLAAWPVVSGTYAMIANGTRMVQNLTITLVRDERTHRMLRTFTLSVGLLFSGAMAVIAFTPAGVAYLKTAVGVGDDLLAICLPVLRIVVFVPLLVATQNWLQGLTIKSGRTGMINLATFIGSVIALGLLFWLTSWAPIPGAYLAAGAYTIGLMAEVSVLLWRRLAA